MLGLFSKKSDHPLASVKSAQQLLDNLPNADAVEVLQEVAHWVEALFAPDNEFRLEHQFAVLRMLDDVAHVHLRKIIRSYFAPVAPGAFQENRLWRAMNTYFALSELGYMHVLAGLRNRDRGSANIKSSAALICARGIYAIAGMLECAAVRYAQSDPQLWAHLAQFYAYAETEKCQDELLAVYSGAGEDTSVQRLLAGVLMWHSAAVGAFSPLEMHIAKRLIIFMSSSFTVSTRCQPESLFAFDLGNPASPVRVQEEGAAYPPSMRFVSSGAAPRQLEGMIKTLGRNLLPEQLNIGVPYSAEGVAKVAHALAECCQVSLPLRRHPRSRIKVNMNVANGFLGVVAQTDAWLNLHDAASECWDVEDISASGVRCVLPAGRRTAVKIGALVGLQPDRVEHWGAGIVRRMSRDAQNNLHVGVEMLASEVSSIVLHGHDGIKPDAIHPALFLHKADAPAGECWVLMKQDTFSINHSPNTELNGHNLLLLPLGLVEKGLDFDLARYRTMAQQGGDESY